MAKPVALQLYSVRRECEADLPGTLSKVAEMGYLGVELAGLHGMKAVRFANLLADLDLKVCSSHTAMPTRQNVSDLVEEQRSFGNTTLISGYGPPQFESEEKVRAAAAACQEAAALLKPYGMSFGLHNHWWEFSQCIGGSFAYDLFLELAPDVFSELDVYWAAYGKANPVAVVSQNKARIPLLHIKDGTLAQDSPHTAVGQGVLDFPAITGTADPEVLRWLIVELDECATDMLEAVANSYRYLTRTGLGYGRK